MQRTGCDMNKPIATTELLKCGRGILCAIVCYQFTWDSVFLEDRLHVCNDCNDLYHRELTIVVND